MSHTRSSDALRSAALALIAENGIDSLTLSQVAQRAGVARATAYREFGDKDGLLGSLAQHEITVMATETMRGVNVHDDPADVITAIVLNALHFLRNHAAFTYVRDHEPRWLLHAALVVDTARMDLVQTVATTATPVMRSFDMSRLMLPAPQSAELIVRTVLSHSMIQTSTLTDHQVAEAVTRALIAP